MLNAAEIAKQADAMLAEREQEMKELEQQKRRARDIMFKKTQQLKVRRSPSLMGYQSSEP